MIVPIDPGHYFAFWIPVVTGQWGKHGREGPVRPTGEQKNGKGARKGEASAQHILYPLGVEVVSVLQKRIHFES